MTRYALVPAEATEEMLQPFWDDYGQQSDKAFQKMLAASPGQGAVTAAQLEGAVITAEGGERVWVLIMTAKQRKQRLAEYRAFLSALGLTVQP